MRPFLRYLLSLWEEKTNESDLTPEWRFVSEGSHNALFCFGAIDRFSSFVNLATSSEFEWVPGVGPRTLDLRLWPLCLWRLSLTPEQRPELSWVDLAVLCLGAIFRMTYLED